MLCECKASKTEREEDERGNSGSGMGKERSDGQVAMKVNGNLQLPAVRR